MPIASSWEQATNALFVRRPLHSNCDKTDVQTGPDRFLHVPSWVVTAVTERQPASPTLYAYYPTKHADATRKSAKLTSLKQPAAAAHLNLYSLTI